MLRSQPSVLPEYKGVDLKDVQVESNLLEGLTFSRSLASLKAIITEIETYAVVSSDPKSRTRDADKEQLQKL